MSSELINRITIKKDGVYVSTHSSNDTSSYHSVKSPYLTDCYYKEGQSGLDNAIIDMCFYCWELRGKHDSVIPYILAINKAVYDKKFIEIRNKVDGLSEKMFDISNGLGEYKYCSQETRQKLIDTISADLNNAHIIRNEFIINLVDEYRILRQLENKTVDNGFINIVSAVTSNYKGYVALVDEENDIFLGKKENYIHTPSENKAVYDNKDNSLIYLSKNNKIFHMLYGSGYVLSQKEMLNNGFTIDDYKEYNALDKHILSKLEKIQEIKFQNEPFDINNLFDDKDITDDY